MSASAEEPRPGSQGLWQKLAAIHSCLQLIMTKIAVAPSRLHEIPTPSLELATQTKSTFHVSRSLPVELRSTIYGFRFAEADQRSIYSDIHMRKKSMRPLFWMNLYILRVGRSASSL